MRLLKKTFAILTLALSSTAVLWAQPEAVDLGLDVKWAACNLGADTPEASGEFYAWGELNAKDDYTRENYLLFADSVTKYRERFILNRQLDAEDDVVRQRLGGGWRMPTFAETNALVQECDWVWTDQNGVPGYKVTSRKNGNSIFLPATGYKEGDELLFAGSAGRYWTATRHPYHWQCAMDLFFSDSFHYAYFYGRYRGYPIRPVWTTNNCE